MHWHHSLSYRFATIVEHQRSSEKYSVVDLLKAVWRVYSKDYSHCFKCSGAFDPNQNYSLKAGEDLRRIERPFDVGCSSWCGWAAVLLISLFLYKIAIAVTFDCAICVLSLTGIHFFGRFASYFTWDWYRKFSLYLLWLVIFFVFFWCSTGKIRRDVFLEFILAFRLAINARLHHKTETQGGKPTLSESIKNNSFSTRSLKSRS